jgi:methyltransferase (TIGR00027 family)
MRAGEPSRTAFGAAVHRAAHQDLEDGSIFRDPLAWRILGLDEAGRADVLERARRRRPYLRLFIAVRHRFAEDALAAAVTRGTRQAVVLGAGLDTFAYRNPHPGLRVFEVDHPATSGWKLDRLADSGIDVPDDVRHVGCDFESEDFLERLLAAGLDPERAVFFLWLGVVPYLSPEAVERTLARIGALPDAEVVFDHAGPQEGVSDEARAMHDALAARVAAAGEPFRATYTRAQMEELLGDCGFDDLEVLGRREILRRWFGIDSSTPGGGQVVRARVGRPGRDGRSS